MKIQINQIKDLLEQAGVKYVTMPEGTVYEKFAELILKEMHRKVIASILITDVIWEANGKKPTSEDYIRAIHKDFGVEV